MEDYKNILWIEDVDNNNAKIIDDTSLLDNEDEDENINYDEAIKKYFYAEQVPYVQLETKYRSALKILEGDCNRYDLIVFDLDFNKDKDDIQNNYDEIYNTLKKGHILPQVNIQEFIPIAGHYLYLYLAMRGYPTNRMVILTGNADSYKKISNNIENSSNNQEKRLDLYLQKGVDIIDKAQVDKKWLKKYYSGKKNTYYRIRRLVFQACEYWKSCIKNKEPKEIPFNQIYYKKNPILTDVFIDMLDHIKMLFPVARPASPEKIYYQAMQTASSLHEKSADINNKVKVAVLKKYHSCVRNFRNWTAHNKLCTENKRSLDGEQFALLFCIAMRTYFDTDKPSEKPSAFSSGLFDYEKLYDFAPPKDINIDSSVLSKKFMDIWLEIVQNDKSDKFLLNLDTAVREYGNIESVNMNPCHLFLPLWGSDIIIQSELVSHENKNTAIIQYTIGLERCTKICDEAKENDTNAIFMLYSYKFL